MPVLRVQGRSGVNLLRLSHVVSPWLPGRGEAVGSPYATSRGTYHIDEESQRVVVLHEYDYAHRATIWRYELDGQDGLNLHQQIERDIGAPPVIDDEGNEVTVTETTAIWAYERVVE